MSGDDTPGHGRPLTLGDDMFGFFSRIRERARAAVLLGVADAADDLLGPDPAPADLDRVRALLARAGENALPAAPEPEAEDSAPAKRGRAKG